MSAEDSQKPKCPDCDTELVLINGKPPTECAKCGFDLEGFPIFERMFKALMKKEIPPRPEPEPVAEPRKGLAGLLKKKKH